MDFLRVLHDVRDVRRESGDYDSSILSVRDAHGDVHDDARDEKVYDFLTYSTSLVFRKMFHSDVENGFYV